MRLLRKNGHFRRTDGKLVRGESCADINCGCCPCQAIRIDVEGVTVNTSARSLYRYCTAEKAAGSFPDATFIVPKATRQFQYVPRIPTYPTYNGYPTFGDCNFEAFEPNFAPLRIDTFRAGFAYPGGYGDFTCDPPDPEDWEWGGCMRGLRIQLIRNPAHVGNDHPNRWLLIISIETLESYFADYNDPGRIFEATFEWDGISEITVSNEVGGPAWEPLFDGGTVTISCADTTEQDIPGGTADPESEDYCGDYGGVIPLKVYVFRAIYAVVECRSTGWHETVYYPSYPIRVVAPDCATAEAIMRAFITDRFIFYDTTFDPGISLNEGWLPTRDVIGNVIPHKTAYVYFLGYCQDNAAPDPFAGITGWIESSIPGASTDTSLVPFFDQIGYVPHVCNNDCRWLYRFVFVAACDGSGHTGVLLLAAWCAKYVPELINEDWEGHPGTPTHKPFDIWVVGEACDCITRGDLPGITPPYITPPDAPTTGQIIDACEYECITCGDCTFASNATADIDITVHSGGDTIRSVATGMALITEGPDQCKFRGDGTRTTTNSGGTTVDYVTFTAYFDGSGWVVGSGSIPGDCNGATYSDDDVDFLLTVNNNACTPVDMP